MILVVPPSHAVEPFCRIPCLAQHSHCFLFSVSTVSVDKMTSEKVNLYESNVSAGLAQKRDKFATKWGFERSLCFVTCTTSATSSSALRQSGARGRTRRTSSCSARSVHGRQSGPKDLIKRAVERSSPTTRNNSKCSSGGRSLAPYRRESRSACPKHHEKILYFMHDPDTPFHLAHYMANRPYLFALFTGY